ncbi:hypothetical protein [Petropleomorpha daqingensis]|uniref:Fibronectin type-III domain-containing protein n=1 Tax=Petropleomorpha daqingensis TaxID=2026353 RepID=A0A853CES3_9ACTN|nr:hypothetical protein [Petropleomorpha daqingensis]NYJ05072.1 hypothetical protein [Petropleomorpha daqingensis]
MSTARRAVLVLVLAVSTVLAGGLAAEASFSESVGGSTSITTNAITAPTGVTAVKNSCSNARWIDVTISWQPSPSARINGYAVTAYRSDGQVTMVGTTGTGSTALRTTVDKLTGASTVFTVTTTTSYGWTAESLSSASITC